ncbi:MAG TPA: hypothetical protein VGR26_15170 [Acidimicrobiales bacterium]|nr:hypothetical protein [Acidimicrobiales bacterium]
MRTTPARRPGKGMSTPAHRRCGSSWARRSPPEHREPILADPEQAGGRHVAKRRLSELADVVGQDQAVRQATDDWPDAVLWPMGFLVDRLRRRLAETHGAGLKAVGAQALARQADRRRRAGLLAGAANLGRTWAGGREPKTLRAMGSIAVAWAETKLHRRTAPKRVAGMVSITGLASRSRSARFLREQLLRWADEHNIGLYAAVASPAPVRLYSGLGFVPAPEHGPLALIRPALGTRRHE